MTVKAMFWAIIFAGISFVSLGNDDINLALKVVRILPENDCEASLAQLQTPVSTPEEVYNFVTKYYPDVKYNPNARGAPRFYRHSKNPGVLYITVQQMFNLGEARFYGSSINPLKSSVQMAALDGIIVNVTMKYLKEVGLEADLNDSHFETIHGRVLDVIQKQNLLDDLDLNTASSDVVVSRIHFLIAMSRLGYIDFNAKPEFLKKQIDFAERTIKFFLEKNSGPSFEKKDFYQSIMPVIVLSLLVTTYVNAAIPYSDPSRFIPYNDYLNYFTAIFCNAIPYAFGIPLGTASGIVFQQTRKYKNVKPDIYIANEASIKGLIENVSEFNPSLKVVIMPKGGDMTGFEKIEVVDIFRDAAMSATSFDTILDFESSKSVEELNIEEQIQQKK
jgi:hypothetical protein